MGLGARWLSAVRLVLRTQREDSARSNGTAMMRDGGHVEVATNLIEVKRNYVECLGDENYRNVA